jgi:hypothetical protein
MARPPDDASSRPPSPPSGPITRARAKMTHGKVNSFLLMCDLDPKLDGMLPHANALCILRYDSQERPQGSMEEGGQDGEEKELKQTSRHQHRCTRCHTDPVGRGPGTPTATPEHPGINTGDY